MFKQRQVRHQVRVLAANTKRNDLSHGPPVCAILTPGCAPYNLVCVVSVSAEPILLPADDGGKRHLLYHYNYYGYHNYHESSAAAAAASASGGDSSAAAAAASSGQQQT